jgi:predicted O-linked N-acetylglucosamine transferase (SPINDLY family)
MPAISLLPHVAPPVNRSTESAGIIAEEADVLDLVDSANCALADYVAKPADAALRLGLADLLRKTSAAISFLPRKNPSHPAVAAALDLVRALSESGVSGGLFDDQSRLDLSDARERKHWPQLIARMLLQPAWQPPCAPSFADVPDWLWADYSAWIFSAPHFFHQPGEADAFAAEAARKMEELVHWVGRNVGSPTVRSALQAYLANFSFLPLTVSNGDLKRHAELHGKLLTTNVRIDKSITATTGGRYGRTLRVAYIGATPASIPESSRLLDPERFEISLYVLDGAEEANGADANAASFAILSLLKSGNRTRHFQALAPGLADQLSELQTANLDIVIFTDELAATDGRLHQLAMHRLAPLHVINGATISSGIPNADLFVSSRSECGQTEIAGQFSERLAIREGCHLTFGDMPMLDQTKASARTRLNLPADAFVLMSAARSIEISPEVQEACVGVLRTSPNVRLVLQLLHAASLPPGAIESFAADWDRSLEEAGVASDRLMILAGTVESLAHLQSVVIAADVFLDLGAFAEPDLLHVPLALHKPIVSIEGNTFRARRGAGLLRSLQLDDLIAQDFTQLRQRVEWLAKCPAELESLSLKLRSETERLPLCRDHLAVAESLGLLLENAYDDLHGGGSREFRRGKAIETCADGSFSVGENLKRATEALTNRDFTTATHAARDVFRVVPAHAGARWIFGLARLELGQSQQAIDYLLAAVQNSDNAATWFDLAVALYRNSQHEQAVQALETSLRLDGTRTDAWAMLIELAHEVGAQELAGEALSTLTQLAPLDPRIAIFADKLRQS